MTAFISTISPDDKGSYCQPIISFDVDWANDIVLADTMDLVEKANINSVWFVTHISDLLVRLKSNPLFEVGIHPNFNGLLNRDFGNGKTAVEVVDRLLSLVPEAKIVRSHSVTQSSRLSQLFLSRGLTHEANDYIPASSGLMLHPWRLETGLVKVSYFWSDELACVKDTQLGIPELASRLGLKVFDFHPIHVFLNTEHLNRYERTRHLHHEPEELIKHRHKGEGTRTRLIELLKFVGLASLKREQTL
jgi:hypothetical protein